MKKCIDFTVYGKPITQGSLTSFPYMKKSGGMGVSTPQSKGVVEWRKLIQEEAMRAYPDLLDGVNPLFPRGTPVRIILEFYIPKPESNKDIKPINSRSGDIDKYARCVLDALKMLQSDKDKGIRGNKNRLIYDDDSQVVDLHIIKKYANNYSECGVWIMVWDD